MYKITFGDGTVFEGGTPEESNWNSMPQKPIKKLEYQYKDKTIILEGYILYNHVVDRVFLINSNKNMIKGIRIMAVRPTCKKITEIYGYDFEKECWFTNISTVEELKLTGWKRGAQSNTYYRSFS